MTTDTQSETTTRNWALGALWEKTSARGVYMTGKIDPSRWDDEMLAWVIETLTARQPLPLVVFKRDKTHDPEGSRRPDWDLVRPREKAAPESTPSLPDVPF